MATSKNYLDKHRHSLISPADSLGSGPCLALPSIPTTVAFPLPTMQPGTFSSPLTSSSSYQTLISQSFCLDADIETADDFGYSIYTVVIGQACEFDLFN